MLVRARSSARLVVAGKPAAGLPFPHPHGEGQDPVRRDALTLGPTRQVDPGDREIVAPLVAPGGPTAPAGGGSVRVNAHRPGGGPPGRF